MNRRSFLSGLLAATALRAPSLPAALDLSEASLVTAMVEIRRFADVSGVPIALRPRVLIFPPFADPDLVARGAALMFQAWGGPITVTDGVALLSRAHP